MLHYPNISPIAFSIGTFSVRWYSLAYICGFLVAFLLGKYRLRKVKILSSEQFEFTIFYAMLGVILGARFGYILFYSPMDYIQDPLSILRVWQGGMSFHGGLLGVLLGLWVAARKAKIRYLTLVDFVAPLVPPGLFFGRLGNFVNGELWGRTTGSSFGMIFPSAGALPRHPSQLYEAFFEGFVLFCIVWIFSSKKRPTMAVSGVFALGYGVFRFCVEFFREPDAHLGYLAGGFLTMGMALCLPLIGIGLLLLYLAYRPKKSLNS